MAPLSRQDYKPAELSTWARRIEAGAKRDWAFLPVFNHDAGGYAIKNAAAPKVLLENSGDHMIRKLKSGKYRLYSRKKDPKTGRRRNLGTFDTLQQAQKHERAIQYFKRRG